MQKRQQRKHGKRALSNLELTFLGLAWLRGPCTVYSVMKELSLSASSFHKSRAGAAYSVSKRLTGFGYLERLADDLVGVTPEGVSELEEWFNTPVPMSEIAHSADLIRLRFFFIGIVDKERRLEFIDSSIKGLTEFLDTCEGLLPKNEALGDYFGVLATVSTIYETRARIEWLKLVRRWVVNPPPTGVGWTEAVMSSLPAGSDSYE